MSPHPIVGLVTTLTAADPAGCTRTEIAELAAQSAQVRCWLDAFDATLAAASPDPTVVSGGGRRSSREANTVAARGQVCADMPELHDALGGRDGGRRSCRCGGPGRRAGRAGRALPAGRAGGRARGDGPRCRRWTGSNATSVTSPASCRPMTGWGGGNGSAGNGSCTAGPTARPGCATPMSPSTPKPTPASRPCSTRPSPRSGPRRRPKRRTFDQLRADAFVAALHRTSFRGAGRPAEVSVLIDAATLTDGSHDRHGV